MYYKKLLQETKIKKDIKMMNNIIIYCYIKNYESCQKWLFENNLNLQWTDFDPINENYELFFINHKYIIYDITNNKLSFKLFNSIQERNIHKHNKLDNKKIIEFERIIKIKKILDH